jgi:hypothetical protein
MTYATNMPMATNPLVSFFNNLSTVPNNSIATTASQQNNLADLIFSRLNNASTMPSFTMQNPLSGLNFGATAANIPLPKPFALPLPAGVNIAAPSLAPAAMPALGFQELPVPAIAADTTPIQPFNSGSAGGYTGDPHFKGFDGEAYDVMGQDGKTYNILSDKGFQYNARFGSWGGTASTINSAVGLQVGRNRVEMDVNVNKGAPIVNGVALKEGETIQLDDQGSVTLDKGNLITKTKEYTTTLINRGQYIDSDVKINEGVNPLADGVAPHGILGQTADGIAGAHVGVNNTNVANQGGTVIDGTVDNYEVNGLFDTGFSQFNRFNRF